MRVCVKVRECERECKSVSDVCECGSECDVCDLSVQFFALGSAMYSGALAATDAYSNFSQPVNRGIAACSMLSV